MTRGAQTSREQPRDRAPPILSSANRALAFRINEPFCAPRNDQRLAQSKADEVPLFDDHIDDLFAAQEVEGQYNNEKRKDTDFWEVTVI
ncbi:hypothetical protein HN51_061878, partial [Arachis hypogaea]